MTKTESPGSWITVCILITMFGLIGMGFTAHEGWNKGEAVGRETERAAIKRFLNKTHAECWDEAEKVADETIKERHALTCIGQAQMELTFITKYGK